MNVLTTYLAVGAVLFGIGYGAASEKCGFQMELRPLDLIAVTVGWPGLVVTALFYEWPVTETVCGGNNVPPIPR